MKLSVLFVLCAADGNRYEHSRRSCPNVHMRNIGRTGPLLFCKFRTLRCYNAVGHFQSISLLTDQWECWMLFNTWVTVKHRNTFSLLATRKSACLSCWRLIRYTYLRRIRSNSRLFIPISLCDNPISPKNRCKLTTTLLFSKVSNFNVSKLKLKRVFVFCEGSF